jgi:sugar phosphate isomerase/epimerase
MISNAWPEARLRPGGTLGAIEHVLVQHPFFEVLQTAEVASAEERRAIRARLSGTPRSHAYTYTLTRGLVDAGLNLSSVEPGVRRRTCERVVRYLDEAREAGAGVVALISGGRPAPPVSREEGLRALAESLAIICPAARAAEVELVLEPLDYEAHKRATLGTIGEAVALCRRLVAQGLPLSLCVDTAHVLLNREDPLAAVMESRAYLSEFHLCNAVLDPAHALFGDRHLPFGPPGVLDAAEVGRIMAGLFRTGYLAPGRRPRVYVEVMKADGSRTLPPTRARPGSAST